MVCSKAHIHTPKTPVVTDLKLPVALLNPGIGR